MAGRWVMYYVVTQTTVHPGPNDNAIGVATAPTPAGPWTDSGAPVVGPRPGDSGNPDDFKWTFDPAHLVAADGRQYLYYGSYYGGVFAIELTADGTRTVGSPTMVAIDNRYEGAYVVPRDGWYYLFASSSNCCAGPVTGYSVFVGRSRSPLGPFVDKQGVSAARVPHRRQHRGHPERQPLGRHRPQRGGHRPVRPGLARLPRDRPERAVAGRAVRHQPAADADRPAGLDRRLADRAGRRLGVRRPGARPGGRGGRGRLRGRGPRRLAGRSRLDRREWTGRPVRPVGRRRLPAGGAGRAATGSAATVRVRAAVRTAAGGTAGLALGRRGDRWATQVTVAGSALTVRSGARSWSAPLPGSLSPRDWHELAVEVRDGVLTAAYGPSGLPGQEPVTLRARGRPGRHGRCFRPAGRLRRTWTT